MPDIGDKAPLFSLQSTNGMVRLSDYIAKGKVILMFYNRDMTPT